MIRLKCLVPAFLFFYCGLIPWRLFADEEVFPDATADIRTYEWTISPVGESSPALKHRLFPDLTETVPGNAAIYYLRAVLFESESSHASGKMPDRDTEWYERRSGELPIAEVKDWLASRKFILHEIASASRCEACDWGIRFQDLRERDVIEVRLMEFQRMRQLARLLKLKAQVEIAERRFDDAIATLRMMYRMANDVAKAPNVIVSLIGTAIWAVTNDVAGELIASEQAPNLYWALRLLPNPIPNPQNIARVELNMAFQLFPFLKDCDVVTRTPEEWMRLLSGAIQEVRQMSETSPGHPSDALNQLSATVIVMRSYPIAKRELLARGTNPQLVEQMPAGQVVSIYARNCYQHVIDEYLKWFALPYHEGQNRLSGLVEELKRDGYLSRSPTSHADHDPLHFNHHLLPALPQVSEAYLRQRRMNALLATVEAIRIHGASNQRQLPARLSDITLVPVPLDPASMKPFLYRIVDGQAELIATPMRPGDQNSGRRFRLKVR